MSVKGRKKAEYPFGMYGSRTYVSWNNMKTRCTSKANEKFVRNYQERGITFCDEWKYFKNFLRDMGVRPDGKTLERVDNSKGYCKSNCIWATYSEQNKNRRTHTNTGHKYITKCGSYYIVRVLPFKSFTDSSLHDAINLRDELVKIRKNNLKFKGDSMLVDQITYTKRHNEGDYSYSEYSIVCSLEEKDDALECFQQVKKLVDTALRTKAGEVKSSPKKEEMAEVPPVIPEEVKEEKPKRTRSTKAKETVEEKAVEEKPVVVKEVEPKKVKAVVYDRAVKTHTDMLAAYLNKTYDSSWKTNPKLKEISQSLIGLDFLDENGLILDSFKSVLEGHFGTQN